MKILEPIKWNQPFPKGEDGDCLLRQGAMSKHDTVHYFMDGEWCMAIMDPKQREIWTLRRWIKRQRRIINKLKEKNK